MENQNGLKRNPIWVTLTWWAAVLIFLLILLKGLDIYQGYSTYKYVYETHSEKMRYIRMRENTPNLNRKFGPSDNPINGSKEVLFRTDKNGWIRSSKDAHKQPDLKIFFLGGSTTECKYVEEDKRFPAVVGQVLEDSLGLRVNTYNAGVSGNHSWHSIDVLAHKILPDHPEYVVLLHNANDLATLAHEDSYWNMHPSRSLVMDGAIFEDRFPKEEFPVYPNLARAIRSRFSPDETKEFEVDYPALTETRMQVFESDFKNSLTVFIQLCRTYRIEPVLMTQYARYKEDDLQQLHDRFNQVILETATQNQVYVIDLQNVIDPVGSTWVYDEMHFNNEGSLKAGQFIAQELKAKYQKKAP